jgi:hypothetical protein
VLILVAGRAQDAVAFLLGELAEFVPLTEQQQRQTEPNASVVACLADFFLNGQLPLLTAVAESIPKLRGMLLSRWTALLQPTLTGLASCMLLTQGISHVSYQRHFRELYAPVSEYLGLDLYPPLASLSAHFRSALDSDASGLFAVQAVGRSGRMLNLRAMLTAQLSHSRIRSAIDLSTGVLVIAATVDAFQLSKQRKYTVCCTRIMNLRGRFAFWIRFLGAAALLTV